MRDTEREEGHRQKEKQAPRREPDMGLDPRTRGSHPEPQADAQPLSPTGAPAPDHFIQKQSQDTNARSASFLPRQQVSRVTAPPESPGECLHLSAPPLSSPPLRGAERLQRPELRRVARDAPQRPASRLGLRDKMVQGGGKFPPLLRVPGNTGGCK